MILRRGWLWATAVLLALVGMILVLHRQWWRAEIVMMKAGGQFSDTSWSDIRHLVQPGSGFWLESLPEHPNPYTQIRNPFDSAANVAHGRELFHQQCAACHGTDAHGTGNGPPLAGVVLRHATGDWATYKVISGGIAGTSMSAHPMPWRDTWSLVAFVRSLAPTGESGGVALKINVPAAHITEAPSQDWPSYSGGSDGRRFSELKQIDTANVRSLQVRWIHRVQSEFERVEAVPLVSNGVMFFSAPLAKVFAIDAATGKSLWSFDHPVPDYVAPCCGKVNRGVALLDDRVFIGTLDAHLIAIDAANGKQVWDTVVADAANQYSITSAPLAVKDKIVTGIGGGDFATRGFIAAYDAKDGRLAWRFDTIPAPGAPGHDSWPAGDAWRTGGGATWVTGSFDPHSNLVFWGVGNPAPVFNGDSRKGDNLYSDSVVALDADSGQLRWHFQFTPHDVHDWDGAQVPILVPDPQGTTLLAWPNRNAFYYLLDADSGKFLRAKAFAQQTWAQDIDASGRPVLLPNKAPSLTGTLVYPSAEGATNWWPSAFSPGNGLVYIPVLERASIFFSSEAPPPPTRSDKSFLGYFLGSGQQGVTGQPFYTAIRALNANTGEVAWERRLPDRTTDVPEILGLLATRGDLVFGADRSTVFALDARTGAVLWSFDTGAPIANAPMTYSVGGTQYVTIISGKLILTFGLPPAGAAH